MPLPAGEHVLTIYLVTAPHAWREIAQIPLRVLSAGGFEQIVTTPSLALNNTGQLAQGRVPAQAPSDRDTFQDLSFNLGIQSTLQRRGWTTHLRANALGVTNQTQALRFAIRGDDAPYLLFGGTT